MPPSTPPAATRSPALLLIVAALFATCFAAITWQVLRHDVLAGPQVFVAHDADGGDLGGLLAVDPQISGWVVEHRTAFLTAAAHTVSALGSTLAMTLLGTVACAGLLRVGDRARATLVAVAGFGAAVLVFGGKRLIGRERPPVADRLVHEPSLSYPSGHSVGSCVVIAICAAVFLPHLQRRALRIATGLLAAIFVFAVGWSRVYLAVHWPTDVLGAWCASVALVSFCLAVFYYQRRKPEVVTDQEPSHADTRSPGR